MSNTIKTMITTSGNDLSDCLVAACHATMTQGDIGSAVLRTVKIELVIEPGNSQYTGTMIIAATDGKVLVEHRIPAQIESAQGAFVPDCPSSERTIWSVCLYAREAKALAKSMRRAAKDLRSYPGHTVDIRVSPDQGGFALEVHGKFASWASEADAPLTDGRTFPSYEAALQVDYQTDTRQYGVDVLHLVRLTRAMAPGFTGKSHAVAHHLTRSTVYTQLFSSGAAIGIRTRGMIMHVSLPH